DEIDELARTFGSAIVADNSRERGRRGRRLLGREHQAESLQQQETESVVCSAGEAFDEGRKMGLDDAQLDRGGEYGQQPAADGGPPHMPILRLAGCNVVLAGVAGAVHNLPRQQIEILPQQGRYVLVTDIAFDQPDQRSLY